MGQKAALNLWYFDTRPSHKNCSRAFEGLSYLTNKIFKKNLCLVIFFIHIIQLSFFISEYLPKAGKRLIFYTEKGDLNYVNKNLTKHKLLFNFISQIRQTIKCSGTIIANFAWYRRTKDSVSLFDPKVHLFENSLLKILAQLDISFFFTS